MTVLVDSQIEELMDSGDIVIYPFDKKSLQPASVDVHIDKQFRVMRQREGFAETVEHPLDPTSKWSVESYTSLIEVTEGHFIFKPSQFVLASTIEHIAITNNLVARLEGKSSLARLGIQIHATAGFIDPGFRGNITLELINVCGRAIKIYPGMPIGQLSFFRTEVPARVSCGDISLNSKYQDQKGPTPSQYWKNFK